jgi:hypothetical protein
MFFALLRKAVGDEPGSWPEIIVVFDGEQGSAERREADPGYKATRPDDDEALRPVRALGDVKAGLDFYQLLRDPAPGLGPVRVLNTARRPGSRLIGPAEVTAPVRGHAGPVRGLPGAVRRTRPTTSPASAESAPKPPQGCCPVHAQRLAALPGRHLARGRTAPWLRRRHDQRDDGERLHSPAGRGARVAGGPGLASPL